MNFKQWKREQDLVETVQVGCGCLAVLYWIAGILVSLGLVTLIGLLIWKGIVFLAS
jgi:hypothetical protein